MVVSWGCWNASYINNTTGSGSTALECGANLSGVYKCGYNHYIWKGGSLSLSQLCLRATPSSLSSAAQLCLRVRFYTWYNSQWSKSPKCGTTKIYIAVVSSAFLCSWACWLDSPTHLSLILRQLRVCFLRRSICGLRHLRHYAESWNFIHVCAPRLRTRNATLIAYEEDSGPCKQQRERRSGGDSLSGVCLKRRGLFQQHAQEKAVQQQAEEETASSQAGEKAR